LAEWLSMYQSAFLTASMSISHEAQRLWPASACRVWSRLPLFATQDDGRLTLWLLRATICGDATRTGPSREESR